MTPAAIAWMLWIVFCPPTEDDCTYHVATFTSAQARQDCFHALREMADLTEPDGRRAIRSMFCTQQVRS